MKNLFHPQHVYHTTTSLFSSSRSLKFTPAQRTRALVRIAEPFVQTTTVKGIVANRTFHFGQRMVHNVQHGITNRTFFHPFEFTVHVPFPQMYPVQNRPVPIGQQRLNLQRPAAPLVFFHPNATTALHPHCFQRVDVRQHLARSKQRPNKNHTVRPNRTTYNRTRHNLNN